MRFGEVYAFAGSFPPSRDCLVCEGGPSQTLCGAYAASVLLSRIRMSPCQWNSNRGRAGAGW